MKKLSHNARACRLLGGAALIALTGLGQAAQAQDAAPAADAAAVASKPDVGIEDIVVTAQRRSESVQSTPIAITALTADAMKDRGQQTITDIAQSVPSLNMSRVYGQGRVYLRGIGLDTSTTGAEGGVALNQDGVFFSRSAAALAGFYDVDRVEVLRGPQGTLYGRNSTGGSVNIITKQPTDEFGGYLQATTGNYNTINTEGALNGALNSDGTVMARLSFQSLHHSGFGINEFNGDRIDDLDSQAARLQVLFKPTDRLSITLGADWYHQRDRGGSYHVTGPGSETAPGVVRVPIAVALGGRTPGSIFNTNSSVNPQERELFYGGRLDVRYNLTDEVSLRSLSAYRRSEYGTYGETSTAQGLPYLLSLSQSYEISDQYVQEFQLNWDTDTNKLVAGLFYMHEKTDGLTKNALNTLLFSSPASPVAAPGVLKVGSVFAGRLKTDAAAAYAQDTYSFTPAIRGTLGVRYSWEKKAVDDFSFNDLTNNYAGTFFDPFFINPATHRIDDKTFKSFTPKVGLDIDIAPRTLLYMSWSKGFKSGNYNLGTATAPVSPEKVTAYEAGLKTTLMDGRLRANIAGFYYDYTDLQVRRGTQPPVLTLLLVNAGKARVYGAEGEFTYRPLDGEDLIFSLNASWLHARFTEFLTVDPNRPNQGNATAANGGPIFDLSGSSLPQAPDYKINFGVQYTAHLDKVDISFLGDATWTGRTFFTPFNGTGAFPNLYSQAPTALYNAGINVDIGKLSINSFVKNLTNKKYIVAATASNTLLGGNILAYPGAPRTYGVTIGYKF